MVALREATSEEALFAVEIAMRSSVALPLMCEFRRDDASPGRGRAHKHAVA
jgi:hypothetical protein